MFAFEMLRKFESITWNIMDSTDSQKQTICRKAFQNHGILVQNFCSALSFLSYRMLSYNKFHRY